MRFIRYEWKRDMDKLRKPPEKYRFVALVCCVADRSLDVYVGDSVCCVFSI